MKIIIEDDDYEEAMVYADLDDKIVKSIETILDEIVHSSDNSSSFFFGYEIK